MSFHRIVDAGYLAEQVSLSCGLQVVLEAFYSPAAHLIPFLAVTISSPKKHQRSITTHHSPSIIISHPISMASQSSTLLSLSVACPGQTLS